jgi:hypothetical protein
VFENRVLWRIFGKMHNEELHKLCSLPNIIRMIKSRRVRAGEKRNEYWKATEKRSLGRPRRRWHDNTKTDFKEIEIGWYGVH